MEFYYCMSANVRFSVHYFTLIISSLLFFGCAQDETEPDVGLRLSTSMIILNENGRGEFVIYLTSDGEYDLKALSLPEWLSLSSEGIIVTSNGLRIEIVATSNLFPGSYNGTIELSTNGGGYTTLSVEYKKLSTSLNVTERNIDFGYLEQQKSFYVENTGGQSFNWEIVNTNSFLRYEPTSGNLNAGESTLVTLSLDRSALGNGTISSKVHVTNDQMQSIEQNLSINHYLEEKLLISGTVVDAEYDRIHDVMVFVTSNPSEIRKYDTNSGEIISLALNMPPNSISVSQDGNFAAVGHNGRFSYVDLTAMELVRMYDVTCDSSDIILAPNNWVYVFQRDYQGTEFRCINLSNGAETLSNNGFSYYNSKAKLHPSGSFIYLANNGISPSDFEKYDISNGTATYLYDSPYHGDFEFNGNIWINESGDRLFAKSRNVFDSTDEQSTDMLYDGAIEGNQMIATMDIHSLTKKLYVIQEIGIGFPKVPGNHVGIYSSEFLTYQSSIVLPGFIDETEDGKGVVNPSEGHFLFFDSTGSEFYVLVKAGNLENGINLWAIVSMPTVSGI